MNVIFFKVENLLNFQGSDAKAPSGKLGIAESKVKLLRDLVKKTESRLVLYGDWKKDWDFDETKCTPDGIYLVKKLDRKGLHILDKTKDIPDDINEWLLRHPNVTEHLTPDSLEEAK